METTSQSARTGAHRRPRAQRHLRPWSLALLGLLVGTSCGDDGTSPEPLDLSGTYAVQGVIEGHGCAPGPRPEGPWNPDPQPLPPVGTQYERTWHVEHSGSTLTIRDVPPEPLPDDVEAWTATVALDADLGFTLGPRVVVEGIISTDEGNLYWTMRETLGGRASPRGPAPRIELDSESSEEFLRWDDARQETGSPVTTCFIALSESGVRTSG